MTDGVRIVFETHSPTIDNEQAIATGRLEGALSQRGRQFAAELGEGGRADGIDPLFSSDLARAVETAEIGFGGTGMPVVLDWGLREIDYGELNGAPIEVIERERAGQVDVPFPGEESCRDAVARVTSFMDDALGDASGGCILLVGHTATRWALDHLVDGRPLGDLGTPPFYWREGWEYAVGHDTLAAGTPA